MRRTANTTEESAAHSVISGSAPNTPPPPFDGLVLGRADRARFGDLEILLGPLEFGALSLLVRNHGILVGHSELEKLWGPGGVSPKSVIQLIRILRMKLEDLGLPDAIHSAYGNGYYFGPKNHVVTTTRSEMLVFKAGGLVLDAESRTAMRGARRITLDPATNGCLKVLMETPEETVSRKRLERASAVPGQHRPGREVLDNTIKRLRYKLGEPQIVHNVRGAGYILRTKD